MRNEVMRRTKTNQIKIRSLHVLKWKARADVMSQRKEGDFSTTASTKYNTFKDMQPDMMQNVLKEELKDYVKSLVTKDNATSIQ